MSKSTSVSQPRRKATNRKGTQRKRTQRRKQATKQATTRLRRLESAVAQSMPWNQPGGFALAALLHRPRLNWRAVAGTGFTASKLVSLLLLTLMGTLIYWTESSPDFYVYADSVQFDRLSYLSPEELYARSALDGLSVFWVEADAVQAQIESHPYVAKAEVNVRLPAQVTVAVQEVSPVALWLTDGGELWLMADGKALGSRAVTNPELVRIIDGPQDARRRLGVNNAATQMDPDLLQSALTLSNYLPGLTTFRYAPGPGLYFTLPDSQILVYWGDGLSTDAKLTTLLSILRTLESEGQSVQRIDVRFPNKPYYK